MEFRTIISLAQGFKYAFCDNEADIPLTLAETNIAKQYSIFVNYEPECTVSFSPWKIDGISDWYATHEWTSDYAKEE